MLGPALKAVQIVLLGTAAWLSWGVVSPLVAAAPVPSIELPEPGTGHDGNIVYARYAVIGERNLFKTRDAPIPLTTGDEALEESQLQLRLIGTTASEDPDVSVATIEDKGKRENFVVGIGDEISGARVVGIERRRIVLENRGKREQLSLDDSDTPPTPAARASTRRTAPRARVRRPSAARPTPPPRPPAPAEALGALFSDGNLRLGKGERLTAVNGLSVEDPASIQQVMEMLNEGGPRTLTVTGPDGSVREIVQEAP